MGWGGSPRGNSSCCVGLRKWGRGIVTAEAETSSADGGEDSGFEATAGELSRGEFALGAVGADSLVSAGSGEGFVWDRAGRGAVAGVVG